MFDVIFTSLVANVISFQCDAPQEIWLPGFIGTGGVNETKQNPGGGIKGKRNSTIEATGLFVIRISGAGSTPCELWDRSRLAPLAIFSNYITLYM